MLVRTFHIGYNGYGAAPLYSGEFQPGLLDDYDEKISFPGRFVTILFDDLVSAPVIFNVPTISDGSITAVWTFLRLYEEIVRCVEKIFSDRHRHLPVPPTIDVRFCTKVSVVGNVVMVATFDMTTED